jgi:hypothetical protein
VGATACGPAELDKAGGVVAKPVVLTLANDSSDPSAAQPFTRAVRQLCRQLRSPPVPRGQLQDLCI